MPPRFLERFSNRKVKQGASITLSVKVEGVFTLLFDCLNTCKHFICGVCKNIILMRSKPSGATQVMLSGAACIANSQYPPLIF